MIETTKNGIRLMKPLLRYDDSTKKSRDEFEKEIVMKLQKKNAVFFSSSSFSFIVL